MRLLWLISVLPVLAAAAPAAAWAGTPTKVFPLSTSKVMPGGLAGTPEQLTKAVAAMVGGTIADSSITASATALGCTINDSECLDQLTRVHRVKELVFGTIRVGDDLRVFVKLTRFIAGTERRERTFVLTSDSAGALGKQLARASREMFDLEPDDGTSDPDPGEAVGKAPGIDVEKPRKPKPPKLAIEEPGPGVSPDGPGAGPSDAPPRRRRGVVTTGTYALVGGGLVASSVGTGLLIAAWALSDDIDRAPRVTLEDLQRLAQLERASRLRTQAGGVLLALGGVAMVSGIVRAVVQTRRPADGDRVVSLVPVDRGAGAALVLSGRFP